MRIFRHYISGVSLAWLAGDILIVLLAYSGDRAMDDVGARRRSDAGNPPCERYGAAVLHRRTVWAPTADGAPRGHRRGSSSASSAWPSSPRQPALCSRHMQLDRCRYFATIAVTPLALIAWRLAWMSPWAKVRTGRTVLVVGTGPIGDAIAELEGSSARPFRLAGFVDDDPSAPASGHRVLGGVAELPRIVDEIRPNLIVVANATDG